MDDVTVELPAAVVDRLVQGADHLYHGNDSSFPGRRDVASKSRHYPAFPDDEQRVKIEQAVERAKEELPPKCPEHGRQHLVRDNNVIILGGDTSRGEGSHRNTEQGARYEDDQEGSFAVRTVITCGECGETLYEEDEHTVIA